MSPSDKVIRAWADRHNLDSHGKPLWELRLAFEDAVTLDIAEAEMEFPMPEEPYK